MKNKLILVILLCLLLCVSFVNAETLNGTLGISGINSTNFDRNAGASTAIPYQNLWFKTIESAGTPTALIAFRGYPDTFDANAPIGASTSVDIYLSNATRKPTGNVIGTGTLGYQRVLNNANPPVDIAGGYTWLVIDSLNTTGLSGDKYLSLVYDASGVYNMSARCIHASEPPVGAAMFREQNTNFICGLYTYNKDSTLWGRYETTKPSGLGITGTIYKDAILGGTKYNSRGFVWNATGTLITSDTTFNQNSLTFNIPSSLTNQIKIGILSPDGTYYNSSVLFSATPPLTPTPTPTPVVSPYTIELSADYANYNEPITGTLLYNGVAATAANTRAVDWIYRDASLPQDTDGEYTNNINYVENGNTTKHLNYGWNGSQFVGWDTSTNDFTNAKGASLPNALSLYTLLSGSVTVQCMVYPTGGGAPSIVTHPLTVGGTGSMYNIVIHAVDWQTGSIIGGSTISVKEKLTNTWSNLTTDDSGYRRVSYPMGTPLYIYASASGYVPDFLNYQVMGNDFVNIQLYRSGTEETNASLSTLLVRTFERNDIGQIQPLNGVTVSLSDGQVKTSSGGTAQFTVANNTAVSIDAFKTGYVSATKRVTPNSALTTATLYLYSTSSTLVPTPFPTATQTPYPTQTPQGNLTTCQQTLPAGADVMDVMQNNIACWGIDDLEGQNFTMAALIILLCAMVLGKFGKGDGAAIGAIIGFVISYARHLIPFYILIIAIALIAAYFAQKFFGSK